MARPLRIEYSGAWYHVLNRGRRKETVFFSDGDYRKFLSLLGDVTDLFAAEIHAYSLMPNHYHLLICTPNGNISRIMRHLNGVYTQYINTKYKTEGSLFRGRFKSILINDEEYLLELVRYIHRNPYKAKLEKRIGEHRWTSHRGYMRETYAPEWLRVKEVLRRFSRYGKAARRELDAFVNEEPPKDLLRQLDSTKWPAVLGGEAFKEMIKRYVCGERLKDDEIVQGKPFRHEVAIEVVARQIEESAGMERGQLSLARQYGCAEAKRAFVYVCREHLGSKQRDICAELGNVTGAVITRLYKKAKQDIEKKRGAYWIIQKFRKASSQRVKT